MAEKDIPNPSSALAYFLIITIIYVFFTIFSLYSSSTIRDIDNSKSNVIYNFIYIIIILIGTYMINLNTTKAICDTNVIQWSSIFFITLLPWIIIFFVLYFILEIFPGWVKPFSNTIGYAIVDFLGASRTMQNILPKKPGEDKELKKAINNIEKNYSKFINEIDVTENDYQSFVKRLFKEDMVDPSIGSTPEKLEGNKLIIELFRLVNIKHIIGKVVWYILAGILISSITYNFIINITCENTLDNIRKKQKKIIEEGDGSQKLQTDIFNRNG